MNRERKQEAIEWMKSEAALRPMYVNWDDDLKYLADEIKTENFSFLLPDGDLERLLDHHIFEDYSRYQLKYSYELPEEDKYVYFDVEVKLDAYVYNGSFILSSCLDRVNFAGCQFEGSDEWSMDVRTYTLGDIMLSRISDDTGIALGIPKQVRFLR